MSSSLNARVFAAAVLAATLPWSPLAARAQAPACSADTDCEKGFTCEVVGSTGCAVPPCAPGEKCLTPEPCTATEVKGCLPGPCSSDTDCASGMVCHASTVVQCTGQSTPNCTKDACPQPDAAACTQTMVKQCTPRYLLPCSVDADCGEHFTCIAGQECACSGGSGSSGGGSSSSGNSGAGDQPPQPQPLDGGQAKPLDATVAPLDAATSCTCTPSDTKHCEVVKIVCTDVAQCPDAWSCVQASRATATCAAPAGIDAGPCTLPDAAPGPGECLPPYRASQDLSKGGVEPVISEGTSGSSAPASDSGHAADGGLAATNTNPNKHSGGICSVAQVGRGSGAHALGVLWLLLAGSVLVRRRRNGSAASR